MKALQAQHTQNLMNANTIVPGNAKKVYICTAGLSIFNEYSNSINFLHKGPKRRWKKLSNYNTQAGQSRRGHLTAGEAWMLFKFL